MYIDICIYIYIHASYIYIGIYTYARLEIWGLKSSKSFPLKREMLCKRCVCVCEGVSASVVRGVWLSRCMRFKICVFVFFCLLGLLKSGRKTLKFKLKGLR